MSHYWPVGVDIGAAELFVVTPTTRQAVSLENGWHQLLPQLIASEHQALVALEPTGRHYSAPIVQLLARSGALVIQVDHATTKAYRNAHVGPHKTDSHDADALMRIAAETVNPFAPRLPIRGTKLLDPLAEDLTSALRAAIEGYRRALKDQTRSINRLQQLSHHIWPALSQHIDTYLRAVSVGAVTPQQLHALARQLGEKRGQRPEAYSHGNSRAALARLVDQVPEDLGAPPVFEMVITILAKQHDIAQRTADQFEELLRVIIFERSLKATTQVLATVPRCSVIAIASLHAAAHCHLDQMTPAQLRGAIGFHPQRSQSGSRDDSEQPMKGYRAARGALHMWCMALLDPKAPPNPVRDFWQQKKAENHPYAFQAARGKLVRILAGIAMSGQPCNWPANVIEGPDWLPPEEREQ